MPLYDFACPHGHRFEHSCRIAEREQPIPCEGKVNDLVLDDDLVAKYSAPDAPSLPDDLEWVDNPFVATDPAAAAVAGMTKPILVRKVPCRLKATLVISHANPGAMLDHGSASNRDAAREGRYDPMNPNRRFMTKGRQWRR